MKLVDGIARGVREQIRYRMEPGVLRSLADLYWAALLVLAGGTALAGAAFGFWQFFFVSDAAEPSVRVGSGQASFDRTLLEEVIPAFESRVADFNTRKGDTPSVADPSR